MFCDGKFVYEDQQENQRQIHEKIVAIVSVDWEGGKKVSLKEQKIPGQTYGEKEDAIAVMFEGLAYDLLFQLLTWRPKTIPNMRDQPSNEEYFLSWQRLP